MKTSLPFPSRTEAGSALALTIVMTAIALAILGSALTWSANTTRATHRAVQYSRSIVAAEAAVEKVVTRINRDYLVGGEKMVSDNVANYRASVPTTADSPYWGDWEFNDVTTVNRTYVQSGNATNYVVLDSTYSGLRAFVSTYQVIAHARDTTSLQNVVAGVSQEIQLASIPIFQFAMYSSGDMEISCGQPFRITGRVHANQTLYVEPDSQLTFQSDVTAVTSILFRRHPDDKRGSPAGSAVYEKPELKKSPVSAMTLPIGTNNSPLAIREIIQPVPSGEDPNSPIGRQRYHNLADMILEVRNIGVTATSGRKDGFATSVPTSALALFVTTNGSFTDNREGKTVRPIDINVGVLAEWSRTNSTLGPISSLYVIDRRTLGTGNLGAVRLKNGRTLPAQGLTVATARPLYVQGHYNQTNSSHLGTANTTATRPASLVGDALTILSENWNDGDSTKKLDSRIATDTTVNAAILTGVVETAYQPDPLTGYSGGMENFPRFLERWSSATLTYNGSMVRMFPSRYATSPWGKDDVYNPPRRNWAFDMNFNDPNKLPPLTPRLLKVFRGQWAIVAPDKNTVASYP